MVEFSKELEKTFMCATENRDKVILLTESRHHAPVIDVPRRYRPLAHILHSLIVASLFVEKPGLQSVHLLV
jgi:hypothetical protein